MTDDTSPAVHDLGRLQGAFAHMEYEVDPSDVLIVAAALPDLLACVEWMRIVAAALPDLLACVEWMRDPVIGSALNIAEEATSAAAPRMRKAIETRRALLSRFSG